MNNDLSNVGYWRVARNEKDIERLQKEINDLQIAFTRENTELRKLIYTLERRMMLSIALPVITMIVTIILTLARLG